MSPETAVARLFVVLCLMLVASIAPLMAATELPRLTGRVVDEAGLLSPQAQMAIEAKLRALEDKSGIQLEVATVKTLGGEEIEPYANRLFRAWKLGEAKKNNGVLMLVAPAEHKARIEVGYGLEGTLTDALSKLIIANGMAPKFKANNFEGGIQKGVDDVIAVLSTDSAEWQKRPDLQQAQDDSTFDALLPFLVIAVILLIVFLSRNARSGPGRPGGGMVFIPTGGGSPSGGGSSLGESGGGFSGGGGSSGGGGASGDW